MLWPAMWIIIDVSNDHFPDFVNKQTMTVEKLYRNSLVPLAAIAFYGVPAIGGFVVSQMLHQY